MTEHPHTVDREKQRLGVLLAFLSVASFFDGFDFMAITQILPNLRAEFDLGPAQGGLLIASINVGAAAAYALLGAADRLGRRRLLSITIAGYTIFTGLSGLAPSAVAFGALQFFARLFLVAEVAVAMVYAAEEFPAERRGQALGIIQGALSLGMVACAAITPLLLRAPTGWRTVYFVGLAPLVLVALARRSLGESRRYEAAVATRSAGDASFGEVWRGPYRRRIVVLGLAWCCTYYCTQSAVTFWKEFAVAERGFTDAQVGLAVSTASLIALPLVFGSGRLLDRLGRRWGGSLIYAVEIAAVLACYSLHGVGPLTLALIAGVFGAGAVQVVLSAYTTEVFPTEARGRAYALSNHLIGRIGYILSPLIVGQVAASTSWAWSVRLTSIGLVAALALVLVTLPETASRDLDTTAAL